jgi:hypothetical protein
MAILTDRPDASSYFNPAPGAFMFTQIVIPTPVTKDSPAIGHFRLLPKQHDGDFL